MCGLVSLVTSGKAGFTNKEIDVFSQMLYADQLRGKDGTGVFFNVKKNKAHVRVHRAAVKSSEFLATNEYEGVCKTLFNESNFIVGHNRWATKGTIEDKNTHPFKEQHITLVHNGTLFTHKDLHDTEVDSHAICHSFANIGYKETLKKLDGAFALIWFDSKDRKLRCCRNWQRPLYVIKCAGCHILVSELELGLWIAKRNDMTVLSSKEVEPRKVYSFDLNDMSKYEEEDVEYRPYVAPAQTYTPAWKPPVNVGTIKKKLLSYAYGSSVRFKAGDFIEKIGKFTFIEGDIIRFQGVAPEYIIADDYEDKWRIRVFGTEEYLKTRLRKKNLVGIVNQGWRPKNGDKHTQYELVNVTEYLHNLSGSNVALLPKPTNGTERFECELCGKQTPVKDKKVWEDCNICPDCLKYECYIGTGC